jgi:hypothetical protein
MFANVAMSRWGTFPFFLQDFVDRHETQYNEIQLPLSLRQLIELGYRDEVVRPV